MTARRRWIAAACLLLAPPVLATAADKPTDCFGDPLPNGVAARMGTVRFRHGGDVEFVGYLPDGKTILSFGKDDTVRWWDAESGKELRRRSARAAGIAGAVAGSAGVGGEVGDDVVLWDAASGKGCGAWRGRTRGWAGSPFRRIAGWWRLVATTSGSGTRPPASTSATWGRPTRRTRPRFSCRACRTPPRPSCRTRKPWFRSARKGCCGGTPKRTRRRPRPRCAAPAFASPPPPTASGRRRSGRSAHCGSGTRRKRPK